MTGYLHPSYAESLSEFGKPRLLSRSGSWILERPIVGLPYHDAMGCYPLFFCRDWSELHADLANVEHELISLAVVTDPFGEFNLNYLRGCFKDLMIHYKQHFVTDLSSPLERFVSAHHLRYARKGLEQLRVEMCDNPSDLINEWTSLYDKLIARHGIKGIGVFSQSAFEKQLRIPGLIAFRAACEEQTVGMTLWCVHGTVGYYHLGAYNDAGYLLRASFALFWFAFTYFAANDVRWLDLGSGAGVRSRGEDGLTRFKRGWSTATRTAYFCGRIFQPLKYQELSEITGKTSSDYFPAYRESDFG
jgi:hypothetical protein